jgi:FlgD Ig-like domain
MLRSTFPSAPLACLVLGVLLSAAPLAAQPVIEVSPTTLDLAWTTLGDTAQASITIANHGDAPLTVTSIDVPAGVLVIPAPPYVVQPDSTRKVGVAIAPLDTIVAQLRMGVESDDPVNPTVSVGWENRGLPIRVETLALGTAVPFPLGEPIVVESVPLEGVRVERMTLHFKSGNMLFFDTVAMTENVRAFIGVIPGVSVMEGALEYYVEAENSGFIVLDPDEGDRRPYRIDISSPQHYQLSAVPRNPGMTWRVGEAIDFMLTLGRGTVMDHGTLWYKAGGDTIWNSTDILEMSFTGIAATIPGASVGPTGVQYWSEITTLTTRMTDPNDDPERNPNEIRVSIDNLVEPATHSGERYRLFSAPYSPPAGSGLGTMLSDQDEFGAYEPAKWRAFRYVPGLGANVELPSATGSEFDVAPGRAFWLISRAEHQVNTAPLAGVSTKLTDSFLLTLEPGWNAIGNPYAFSIPWDAVRRDTALGDPVAFDPARNDYSEETPLTLEPFIGYFVENTASEPRNMLIPSDPRGKPRAPAAAAVAAARSSEPAYGWRLEAHGAGGADVGNRVGVAADAAVERDPLDAGEPPPPPDSRVRLAIANREWREAPGLYRRDLRPPGEGNAWPLEIVSREAGVPVEIVIRAEGEAPADQRLRLVDVEQRTTIEPAFGADRTFRHTILSLGAKPYRLTLVAGSTEFVDREGASTGLPDRITLDPAAPNPARGALRLRFGVPREAPVKLEVFDVAGQRVSTLVDSAMPPGYHSVVWQGVRDGGERVSSGMYYFRLATGTETRVVRAVMIR